MLLRDACPLCLLLVHKQQHGPFLFAIFCNLCGMMLSGVYAGVFFFFLKGFVGVLKFLSDFVV